MFGPLKLPSFLHPYPPGFVDYQPTFSRKDNTTGEEHLSSFQDFIDNLEILHEDIIMRLFSKSLIRDVALWFKNMEVASIGSWDELYYTFLKHQGERKSFDQYLDEFTFSEEEKMKFYLLLIEGFTACIAACPWKLNLLRLVPWCIT